LGAGGFRIAYLARDVNREKDVAIMAKNHARLANYFDEIGTDHDGRVSPQQLMDALQGVGVQRQLGLQ
jgi:hypothetical protein